MPLLWREEHLPKSKKEPVQFRSMPGHAHFGPVPLDVSWIFVFRQETKRGVHGRKDDATKSKQSGWQKAERLEKRRGFGYHCLSLVRQDK